MPIAPRSHEDGGESITALLVQLGNGNREAEARLIEMVYGELCRVVRHFDKPRMEWQNRAHFFAVAAHQMPKIPVGHARSRATRKRGGALCRVSLTDAMASTEEQAIDILVLDDLLDRLHALSPRQARVVELRYFGGLDCEEAAQFLGVSSKTVKRDWKMARAWLRIQLAS